MSDTPTQQLYLELDRLHERPLTVAFAYPAASLECDDPTLILTGDVTGNVTFSRVGKDVVAQGELNVNARGACARCLAPTDANVTARVDELWVKKIEDRYGDRRDAKEDEEEDDVDVELTHLLSGDRIELADIFRDVILAEIPARFLCKEDCKGLCVECGADLNAGPCDCQLKRATGKDGGKGDAEAAMPEWKKKLKGLQLD